MEKRILEALESCRHDSDDLQAGELRDAAALMATNPEARELYQRIQQWDATIARGLENLNVADGLQARILARLSEQSPPVSAVAHVAGAPPAERGRPSTGRERLARRRWLVVSGSLAAALLMTVFAVRFFQPRTPSSLEDLADSWLQELDAGTWKTIHSAPSDMRWPAAILTVPVAWQRIGNVKTGRGIAYQLKEKGINAVLFVVKRSTQGLPPAPTAPQSTTGGKSIGYWQNNGLVFMLVVYGNERDYLEFVRPSSIPFA